MLLPPKDFRRELRRRATPAEKRLWRILRDRRLDGLKVRRQHPVGPYVVDFYCDAAQLAIEIDGGVHADPARAAYDADRTRALAAASIRVLRFSNREVMEQVDVVADAILAAARTPHPVPLPRGEGTP
ncbi:endonuclease domain-containing protein [Rubrivirga sp.]|uniref:endonuclease domain-containing protein n=1 Tax=Rubrivirga sp. TaxID=1885344 RepID=UPI003B51587C